MKEELIIVTPPTASNNIDMDLVSLTKYLVESGNDDGSSGGFGLGGEFGYGVRFENNTFMMHPFCWCEQDNCKWCNGEAPNFLHKPSGFEVEWYKWIGRDSDYNRELANGEWSKIYQECIN